MKIKNERKFVNNFKKTSPKLFGGFGNYCCIPGCKSRFYNKTREKTNISLFTVPSKGKELRKKWFNVLKHAPDVFRKGGANSFDVKNPSKRIYVCEFHFKDEDLTTTFSKGKKKVTTGTVPSMSRKQSVR